MRGFGISLIGRLRYAEVDHLRQRLAIPLSDQYVRWLEVAVNHPFLMGMLHGVADRQKQLHALAIAQLVGIAILRRSASIHILHDEVRLVGCLIPVSLHTAMFRMFIKASACRSESKRLSTSREFMPSLITFSAPSGAADASCLGQVDGSMPAFRRVRGAFDRDKFARQRRVGMAHSGLSGRKSDVVQCRFVFHRVRVQAETEQTVA